MKKIVWMFTAILICGHLYTQAQTLSDSVYVMPDDMPDGGYFLPAPPDSASMDFVDDISQWQWGKTVRPTERGAQASRESQSLGEGMQSVMAQVLELDTICDEATPALSHLLLKAYCTGLKCTASTKEQYMRTRPFVMMNEDLWAQYDDESLRSNGSYPSGHTVRGWTMTLLLMEINPDAQDELLAFGYEWGQSRVISGYHWQSDVDASRLVAAAGYSRLHTSQEFLDDMAAARKEFARLKANMHVVSKR